MNRTIFLVILLTVPVGTRAQEPQKSPNVNLIAHVPLGGGGRTGHVVLDQSRPLAFAANGSTALVVDTETGRRIHSWQTPDNSVIQDLALLDRSLIVASSAGVWMVDMSAPRQPGELVRLDSEGARDIFAYKHSDGSSVIFLATEGGIASVNLTGQNAGPIALPEGVKNPDIGFHEVYAAFELATESDRLYAAGAGGYYVYDISDLSNPEMLTWVSSAAIQVGTIIQATPDGSLLVTGTDYRTSPIRIYDLRPALDGTVSQIRTAVGAWTANWRSHSEHVELRWPYVFVAARERGMQMFNMRNSFEPYTTAHFRTGDGIPDHLNPIGAVDLDVRNHDGLVAVTDVNNGLWLLKIDEFTGWDGRGWGQPNISSVQDWENGPVNSDRWRP